MQKTLRKIARGGATKPPLRSAAVEYANNTCFRHRLMSRSVCYPNGVTDMTDARYVLISEAGACLGTLGRDVPSDDEISAAAIRMADAGVAGWVAIASHSFHSRRKPVLTMVTAVNGPLIPFATAAAVCGRTVAEAAKELTP